ncbi:MAG: beta-lactamase family protein [Candidatus Eremiobacteraeota bacterium]|nr:beta-lactamase family protein [Candidatus Eremiobacteraeota bacterium]
MIEHAEMQAVFDECASFVPGTSIAFASVGKHFMRCGSAGAPATSASLFQIGSITKVVTATLYSLAVREGKVKADATLGSLWPRKIASAAVGSLTLKELATHTSGLPRLPRNLDTRRNDCYSDYSVDDMIAFLNSVSAGEIVDGRGAFQYSNLGYALLGQSVAAALDSTFAEAVVDRVLVPLGMSCSIVAVRRTTVPSALMPGFTADGQPADAWTFDAFAPAGAIESTCADVAKFVRASLRAREPVGETIRALARQPVTIGEAMGWASYGPHVRWHNGQTGGFHAMVAVDFHKEAGVVALWNAACDLDDACLFALGTTPAYRKRPRGEEPDPISSTALVGSYDGCLGPFAVSVDERMLTLSGKVYGTYRLYYESRNSLFSKVVDSGYDVVRDGDGAVIGLNERYGAFPMRFAPRR